MALTTGRQGSLTQSHRLANLPEFHRQGSAVARRPGDVPAQHEHREEQDRCGEHLLAGALERIGQGGGEYRDETGAGHTRGDAAGNPASSPDDTFGSRQDDADDQSSFHDFAEDDDKADEHLVGPSYANANSLQLRYS